MKLKKKYTLAFKTPELLQEAISLYFEDCKKDKRPLTMSGLALACGVSRATIVNYGNREKYFDIVKRARDICENYLEEKIMVSQHVAGPIFCAKNNYGWRDERSLTGVGGEPLQIVITDYKKATK